MSGKKLTVVLGVVVVAAVTISVTVVQRRRAEADDLRARIEDALIRGEGRKAVSLMDAASPGLLDPEWAAVRRGEAMVVQRAFKDAGAIAQEILARDPRSIQGMLLQAQALAGPGYKDEALEVLNGALQLAPKDPDLLAERALVWVSKDDRAKALADLDAAIAVAPDHVQARKQRCVIYYEMKRYHESKADCEKALAGMPTFHRDRTFTEYAVHEALEDLEREEDERNAAGALPTAAAPDGAEP